MSDPRYPIGKFSEKPTITDAERAAFIQQIAEAPAKLRDVVKGLNDKQLDTPYRDGGWTVRQVAHHVPDSHLNAYIRFKLGLTENHPTIKPYDQEIWANLIDGKTGPVETSLVLLESVHTRWVMLMRSLKPADFARTILHPENGVMKLDAIVQHYAWHGRHHTAHITSLRERMGW
ncbi:MAG: putative metal-dependent hydrolase [Ignavibacteriae bacterium]|nr:putative metal-dependent hydrolase [Ignavibacteriota bacterium]